MDIIRKNGKKKINPLMIMVTILFIFIIGLISSAFYFYKKYKEAIKNPEIVVQDEKKDITEKVRKLIELPEEEPLIATITDKEKLREQVFFSKAQNGDKILFFMNSPKAILYRPSTNKIIEVSFLIKNSQSSSAENQE